MGEVTRTTTDEAPAAAPVADSKLNFLDLPQEVQKDIFAHCSQSDLICLSLVSRHFREMAAAQLYRNFHIVFPDEDDPAYDSPIDGLAGGLDTFVTSDYDYGKHLRDLSLDTLSAGDKAEAAYKHYLYSVSCGKFMNTLLLLTLKKAKSLETFKWNIRVELSRPVYKALHNIETLKNVHIRLQVGPSLYETPPELPYPPSSLSGTPSGSSLNLPDSTAPPVSLFGLPPPPPLLYGNPANNPLFAPAPKPRPKPKKPAMAKEPPTLSGFKKLRSLAVLDMDTLDAVTEIKACIRNSSSTLTKLKLSFSDQLALQARKPQPDAELDDSDQDDEFQVVPGPPHPAPYSDSSLSLPARAFRAAEERKSQEAVLGRIFDVEPYLVKKPSKRIVPAKEKEKEKEPTEPQSTPQEDAAESATANPAKKFIQAIKVVSSKLIRDLNRSKDLDSSELSATQQEILDTIESAARKYVASDEAKVRFAKTDNPSNGESSASASSSAEASSSAKPETSNTKAAPSSADAAADASSSAGTDDEKKSGAAASGSLAAGPKGSSPEDINIEEPEEQFVLDGLETPGLPPSAVETPTSRSANAGGPVDSPGLGKAMANLAAQKVNFATLSAKLESHEEQADILSKEIQDMVDEDRLAEAGRQVQDLDKNIMDIQQEMRVVEAEMVDAEKQTQLAMMSGANGGGGGADAADSDAQGRLISEYIRATRGLGLQSLSIYLVPVRASVLSKAIDLRVLRRITLLNVGAQSAIWALFAKENKISPLPLRKIFTDNVTPAFLSFVNQLEELHEFFVLERELKYKPESFATKTSTTNEQIRKLVLRKHLPTLRRLMIKNMDSTDWDVDEQTTRLICRKGKCLEELAVSMNIRAIHVFMQNMAGLAQLHALHIIQLRNDDTCVWVMRETKKFLIDNLSHHPEMKLEWISIDDDDRLEKIARITDEPKKSKKAKGKGKEKEKAHNSGSGNLHSTTATVGGGGAAGATTTTTTAAGGGSSSSTHANNANAASGGYEDDVFPILPALDAWDSSSSGNGGGGAAGSGGGGGAGDDGSEEETDDDYDEGAQRTKLETLEGFHFSDVWGVRIFKKEVINGRL